MSNYEQLKHTWVQVLEYWTRMLSEKHIKTHSKAIAFEVDTTLQLLGELQQLPVTTISHKLVQYLVDDILINLAVEQLCKDRDQPFLNPANFISLRLGEFQEFVGKRAYQDLCKSYTEQAIIDALYRLIRRYHFIQYMDDQRKDSSKWLKRERKSAKYSYGYQGNTIRA